MPESAFRRVRRGNTSFSRASLLLLAIAVLLGACGPSSDGAVRVATDATWPPMEYVGPDGEIIGFTIDLMDEIGRRADLEFAYRNVAWDGIFAGLGARDYDVIASSVTILPERAEVMRFTRPYFRAAQYLLVERDRAESGELGSIADLQGETVGAEIATTGARWVESAEGVELRSYDELGLALEDLALGRIGGVVADQAILEGFVAGHPRYGALLVPVGEPYAVEDYGIAVRMDLPELHQAIDQALAEIVGDGTMQEIRDRWF